VLNRLSNYIVSRGGWARGDTAETRKSMREREGAQTCHRGNYTWLNAGGEEKRVFPEKAGSKTEKKSWIGGRENRSSRGGTRVNSKSTMRRWKLKNI